MIYFDNSATTYPKPEVVYEAIDYASRNLAFNAGRGTYNKANTAMEVINSTRKMIGSLVNCNSDSVTFLSSATEALNLIINGLNIQENENVYISPFEHNAIIRPLYNLKEKINFNIYILPFNKKTWKLEEEIMVNMFARNNPKYIFISQVSNVTGFITPYQEIFKKGKQYGSINILDSAQSFGIINPNKTNVDFIVFAGHKSLYASLGVAGFINVNDFRLEVVKSGGNGSHSLNKKMPETTYRRYESGTPNIVAIYSLQKSIEWLKNQDVYNHESNLVNYCLKEMMKLEKIKTYLPPDKQSLGIISFNVDGYTPEEVGDILSDEFDICVRTGFHCSPIVHDFLETKERGGTIRLSFGAFNTSDEIDILIEALKTL
ncbi:MAG: aminotransferase class V-fold PLP-dependent enzyme [Bacilli bacterium]